MSVTISGNGPITGAPNPGYSFDNSVSIAGTISYEDVTNVDSVGVITAQSGIQVLANGVRVATGATVTGSANTLLLETNGRERMRIEQGGKVGIGTDNATTMLQVSGSGASAGRITVSTGNQDNGLGTTDDGKLVFFRNNPANNLISVAIDDDNGNVGIGSTNPLDKLSISAAPNSLVLGAKDTTRNNHIFQLLADDSAGNGEIRLYKNSGSGTHEKTVEIASSGDTYFMGGDVGIGTTDPTRLLTLFSEAGDPFLSLVSNTVNTPGILFGDTDSDSVGQIRYFNDNNAFVFETNGSERLRITSAGRVGINSDAPERRLDVVETATQTVTQFKTVGQSKALTRYEVEGDNPVFVGAGTSDFEIQQSGTTTLRIDGGTFNMLPSNNIRFQSARGVDFTLHGEATSPNSGVTTSTNILDLYEEGSFTPENVTGFTNITQTIGQYVRVGNMVYFNIMFFSTANNGTVATTFSFDNLPYDVTNTFAVYTQASDSSSDSKAGSNYSCFLGAPNNVNGANGSSQSAVRMFCCTGWYITADSSH